MPAGLSRNPVQAHRFSIHGGGAGPRDSVPVLRFRPGAGAFPPARVERRAPTVGPQLQDRIDFSGV